MAQPVATDIDLAQTGTLILAADGSRVLTLVLDSPGAKFISLKFSRFALPGGAQMVLRSADGDVSRGPFTARHAATSGRFGTPPVPGDRVAIMVRMPAGADLAALDVRIESISHGTAALFGRRAGQRDELPQPIDHEARDDGRRDGDAASANDGMTSPAQAVGQPFGCQRDVNCPEGAPYQEAKRAVAEGYDGAFVCSGQLINNTRQDNRTLYLTAAHCAFDQDPDTLVFYWDYENQTCGGSDYPPLSFSTGATSLFVSAGSATDLHLLELAGTGLEDTYDVTFTGWRRDDTPAASGAILSYPDDKPKQVAIENDPLLDCAMGGCGGGFGSAYWRVDAWDVGTTEGGSSGGGLLDENLLLVGVLTGGVGTNCSNFQWDEFSKLGSEWAGLAPFLDPDSTGAQRLPGKDASTMTPTLVLLEDCMAGPSAPPPDTPPYGTAGCLDAFDVDLNSRVDLHDLAIWQRTWSPSD